MTEQELRALVRDAIARHLAPADDAVRSAGLSASASPRSSRSSGETSPEHKREGGQPGHLDRTNPARHASHAMFLLATGADEGGPCVIEPAVACTHCGYCKSYGH